MDHGLIKVPIDIVCFLTAILDNLDKFFDGSQRFFSRSFSIEKPVFSELEWGKLHAKEHLQDF